MYSYSRENVYSHDLYIHRFYFIKLPIWSLLQHCIMYKMMYTINYISDAPSIVVQCHS